MEKRKIIDMHAHIYPEKIAARAIDTISRFYDLEMHCKEGTVGKLKSLAVDAGAVRVVISSVATTPRQVVTINNFIASEAAKDSMFIPFATLHPDMTKLEIREELGRIIGLGFRGIKLHPDFQEFEISGGAAYRIFEEIDPEFPIQLHTGDKRKTFSHPVQMIKAAKDFKHLRFIAAHFGGWSEWEYAEGYIDVNNVWFDTSSAMEFLDPGRAREIINILGEDRFFFGTDYPMWDYDGEFLRLKRLSLSESTVNKILFENAVKFMKLTDI